VKRVALTLIELLAALAIIGVLIALLLPAVQAARESVRRTQCSSNIRQVAIALHQYESTHRVLPSFAFQNYSFHVALLPHLDQQALYDQFDFSINALDYDEGPLEYTRMPVFECPSDGSGMQPPTLPAPTNYHGNWGTGTNWYGNNGVFSYRDDHPGFIAFLPLSAIKDGLSQTAMLGEVLASDGSDHRLRVLWETPELVAPDQLDEFTTACRGTPEASNSTFTRFPRGRAWIDGGAGWTLYNHLLSPNEPSCSNGPFIVRGALTSSSFHAAGVNVARADGSVQHVSSTIDVTTWRSLGSRAGSP
jgi:type II secretory pathway pseudopilin PulG